MSEPHDIPDMAGLVEAVREFLERDVFEAVHGRVQFHTRVAVNVLRMVERELAVGGAQADAHQRALADLGVADDAELAARIKDGAFDDDRVRDIVRAAVRAKLEVANPAYLEGHGHL